MEMTKREYVLRHGNIRMGKEPELTPSPDPSRPTVVQLTEKEAASINGHGWDEVKNKPIIRPTMRLPRSPAKPECVVPLEEYEAERAGEAAAAKAIAEVKAKFGKKSAA